jgi:tetratricopeptide (TPR) repeat protein
LERRLPLLTGGARDLPDRQRTLRKTIEWSYELLDPLERTVFARLAVFTGGWTLSVAETVCPDEANPHLDVFEGLAALVEKSLVEPIDGEDDDPRFTMLETIREFAVECLEESGEAEAARARHADHYVRLAASAQLLGAAHDIWLDRLDKEHDNLRAVLHRSLARGDAETALRLGAALWQFWHTRGYLTEGSRWLDLALKVADLSPSTSELRAAVLNGAGALSCDQGDYCRGQSYFAESLALERASGDTKGVSRALINLGTVMLRCGNRERAVEHFTESLRFARELGYEPFIAMALTGLGHVAMHSGDYVQATSRYEESLAIWRKVEDKDGIAALLKRLATVALEQRHYQRARVLLGESLTLFQQLEDKVGIASCLEGCARVAGELGFAEHAVLLWSAAEKLRAEVHASRSPFKLQLYQTHIATLRSQLSQAAFDTAWQAGSSLPVDAVGESALRDLMSASPA